MCSYKHALLNIIWVIEVVVRARHDSTEARGDLRRRPPLQSQRMARTVDRWTWLGLFESKERDEGMRLFAGKLSLL